MCSSSERVKSKGMEALEDEWKETVSWPVMDESFSEGTERVILYDISEIKSLLRSASEADTPGSTSAEYFSLLMSQPGVRNATIAAKSSGRMIFRSIMERLLSVIGFQSFLKHEQSPGEVFFLQHVSHPDLVLTQAGGAVESRRGGHHHSLTGETGWSAPVLVAECLETPFAEILSVIDR